VFEWLLAEWHITPDYIVNNWTDELLNLMLEKLIERKKRELDAIQGNKVDDKVEDEALFKLAGNLIKVEKSGD